MTISNSTAPTSIIPKPSDVSHIQMVAAQTIFRFPSILTLLISLPWGDGRLLDTGGGGRTRTNFNPLPSCEGRRYGHSPLVQTPSFQSTPLMRGETAVLRVHAVGVIISIHSPHTRGDTRNASMVSVFPYFNPLPSYEGRLMYSVRPILRLLFQSTPLMRGETQIFADIRDV